MAQITITQNNFGIVIETTILDNNKKPISLDSRTITGDLIYPDKTIKKITNFRVVDSVNGKIQYQIELEDTSQVGNYSLYISINSSNLKVTSQNTISYFVIAEDGGVS